MERIISEIIWLGIAYLFGSFPTGLVIAKTKANIDLREVGSGNIGATNVARTCGLSYGIVTFIIDMLKSIIPIIIALKISPNAIFVSLTALASILGHTNSLFLNFKGGKGVATTIGAYLVINPVGTVTALILMLIIILITGYVSLGSIFFVLIMPIFMLFQKGFIYFLFSIIVMLIVINRHKENILRVIQGIENPWKKS